MILANGGHSSSSKHRPCSQSYVLLKPRYMSTSRIITLCQNNLMILILSCILFNFFPPLALLIMTVLFSPVQSPLTQRGIWPGRMRVCVRSPASLCFLCADVMGLDKESFVPLKDSQGRRKENCLSMYVNVWVRLITTCFVLIPVVGEVHSFST